MQVCAIKFTKDEYKALLVYSITDFSEGHFASILGSVVLVFVITCYLMMCVFIKFYSKVIINCIIHVICKYRVSQHKKYCTRFSQWC